MKPVGDTFVVGSVMTALIDPFLDGAGENVSDAFGCFIRLGDGSASIDSLLGVFDLLSSGFYFICNVVACEVECYADDNKYDTCNLSNHKCPLLIYIEIYIRRGIVQAFS